MNTAARAVRFPRRQLLPRIVEHADGERAKASGRAQALPSRGRRRETGCGVERIERRAVALVADERRRRARAETPAAPQPGAREYPVLGLLHRVAVRAPRAVPPAAAVPIADAGQRVLGAVRAGLGPPVVQCAVRAALMTHDRAAVVDDVDSPPADVSAEECDV